MVYIILGIIVTIGITSIYSYVLQKMDLYEREPISLLLWAFLYGAIPSIFISLIMFNESTSLLQVAITEEITKLLLVLIYMIAHDDEVDNWIDAALYGAMVGLGFGFSENLVYLFLYKNIINTLLIRVIIFGLMHPIWTLIASIGVGSRRTIPIITGIVISISLHYFHNVLALSNNEWATIILYLSVAIGVLFVISYGWNYQRKVLSNYLSKFKGKYISDLILASNDKELLHIAMEAAQAYLESKYTKSDEYLKDLNKLLKQNYNI